MTFLLTTYFILVILFYYYYILHQGGNENLLCLWDSHMSSRERTPLSPTPARQDVAPLFVLREHAAAVKALAWCPWEPSTLASGGGTADRHIRVWNTTHGTCTRSVDTGTCQFKKLVSLMIMMRSSCDPYPRIRFNK